VTKVLAISVTLLTALALAAPAAAGPIGTTWVEDGDAGQLPSTAQVVGGTGLGGPLTAIIGTISNPNDVDMYLIRITDPAHFSATTVNQPGTLLDTQLFLFTSTGLGIEANDDTATTLAGLRSTLTPVPNLTVGGDYLLAISAFNVDPLAPGMLRLFLEPEETISPVFGLPVGPDFSQGGSQPVASWTANPTGNFGTYQIALSGAEFTPEPGSVLLFGLGLAGLGGLAWRRRKSV
jgi:hypothetical protein